MCATLAPACNRDAAPAKEPAATDTSCFDDLAAESNPEVDPGDREDGKITIYLTSTPSGALVEVDGEDEPRGVTPMDLVFDVRMYNQVVSVSLDGYEGSGSVFSLTYDTDLAAHYDLIESASVAGRSRCKGEWRGDFGFVVS